MTQEPKDGKYLQSYVWETRLSTVHAGETCSTRLNRLQIILTELHYRRKKASDAIILQEEDKSEGFSCVL